MPACVIKFRSVIQGGTLWPEHDVVFLLQAGLARPGGRVEPPPPGNDFPVDNIGNPIILELPHIFAELNKRNGTELKDRFWKTQISPIKF